MKDKVLKLNEVTHKKLKLEATQRGIPLYRLLEDIMATITD